MGSRNLKKAEICDYNTTNREPIFLDIATNPKSLLRE